MDADQAYAAAQATARRMEGRRDPPVRRVQAALGHAQALANVDAAFEAYAAEALPPTMDTRDRAKVAQGFIAGFGAAIKIVRAEVDRIAEEEHR